MPMPGEAQARMARSAIRNRRCLGPGFRRVPPRAMKPSDRIPAEDIGRAVELVERRLQRRNRMVCDGLRRPAFAPLYRTQRTVLTEQENLVHAHAEDLSGDVLRSIGKQEGA